MDLDLVLHYPQEAAEVLLHSEEQSAVAVMVVRDLGRRVTVNLRQNQYQQHYCCHQRSPDHRLQSVRQFLF